MLRCTPFCRAHRRGKSAPTVCLVSELDHPSSWWQSAGPHRTIGGMSRSPALTRALRVPTPLLHPQRLKQKQLRSFLAQEPDPSPLVDTSTVTFGATTIETLKLTMPSTHHRIIGACPDAEAFDHPLMHHPPGELMRLTFHASSSMQPTPPPGYDPSPQSRMLSGNLPGLTSARRRKPLFLHRKHGVRMSEELVHVHGLKVMH